MSSLLYLELVDCRGDISTDVAVIDTDVILQLAAVVSVEDDRNDAWQIVDESLEDDFDDRFKFGMMALTTFIMGDSVDATLKAVRSRRWNKIWKALDTKGFYVEQWEEGTHGICLPSAKQKCVNEIARIESQLQQQDWSF